MKKLNIDPEITTREKFEMGIIITLFMSCMAMFAYIGSHLI